MLAAITDASAALAGRLSPQRTRTVLLIFGDVLQEVQIGFSWRDAKQELWDCQQDERPVRIIDFDTTRLVGEDVTAAMAIELAALTYDQGHTPRFLRALLDAHGLDYCDPGEDAPRRDPHAEHRLSGRQLGVTR